MSDGTYKLDELAREAGTSARTVRYYVQRGLLPAPAFRGKDTAYDRGHLVRLRAIRRMQEAFYPLDAIAVELENRPLDEIERIANALEPSVASTAPSSGLPEKEEAAVGRQMREGGPSTLPMHSKHVVHARTFHRVELAPGVELSIADDAPPASRLVVDRILSQLGE